MSEAGATVGVRGTDVVGIISAAVSVNGRISSRVVRPQPPATLADGNRYSWENAE